MTNRDESDHAMPAAATQTDTSHILAAALLDYSEIYLDCRGIQHRWNLIKDMQIVEKLEDGDLVVREFECERCTTLRKDRFLMRKDRWAVYRLEVLGASYKYPEDYLLSEMGLTEHPREILRYEIFRRALNKKPSAQVRKIAVKQAAQKKAAEVAPS